LSGSATVGKCQGNTYGKSGPTEVNAHTHDTQSGKVGRKTRKSKQGEGVNKKTTTTKEEEVPIEMRHKRGKFLLAKFVEFFYNWARFLKGENGGGHLVGQQADYRKEPVLNKPRPAKAM